ncbi:hypothetical protein SMICM17S_06887 [Streptomyces microflavus]
MLRAAHLLATHLATVAGAAVILAAATCPAATRTLARHLPVPHRLPLTVAWTGTTASVSMAVATLALATALVLAENWPLTAAAAAHWPRPPTHSSPARPAPAADAPDCRRGHPVAM